MDQRRERLIAKVNQCYQHMDQLPIADRNWLFTKDKDNLMTDDPRFITAWLKLAERIIQINKWDQTCNRRETGVLMENYFKWQPPSNTKRPCHTVKHQKNDLKPDWWYVNCFFRRAVSGSTTHIG
jgi:hypothetical protein